MSNNPTPPQWLVDNLPKPLPDHHWEYRGMGWENKNLSRYTFTLGVDSDDFFQGFETPAYAHGCANMHYFELVKNTENTLCLVVRTFEEWKTDIENKLKHAVEEGDISLKEILESPKLDVDELRPFVEYYLFYDIYECGVLVKHPTERDMYWYVTTGSAFLIYKPQKP